MDKEHMWLDEHTGDWIEKRCPKCNGQLLGNKAGLEWCSFIECDYGINLCNENNNE